MDREEITQLYRSMLRIRRFEELAADLLKENGITKYTPQITCNLEAVITGTISVMDADDFVLSSTSCNGIFLARGGSPQALFAELLGKNTGCCSGKAGAANIFDIEHRYIGGWSITAQQTAIAAGFAYAQTHHKVPNVTVCFLSEGDYNNGIFHETVLLSKEWSLPVIFVIQKVYNSYHDFSEKKANLYSHEFNYDSVNGYDIFAVRSAVHTAITAARDEHIPSIIETHNIVSNAIDIPEEQTFDAIEVMVKKLKALKKAAVCEQVNQEIEKELQDAKYLAKNMTLVTYDDSNSK